MMARREAWTDDKKLLKSHRDPAPSWRTLLHEYTQETTLHGIRYTTLATRYNFRRFLWFIVVTGAITTFTYLLVTRYLFYRTWPKDVNVEVSYGTSLPFPAVTICNQNLFRLTSIQKQGLYDLFNEKFAKHVAGSNNTAARKKREAEGGDKCTNSYIFEGLGCVSPTYEPTEKSANVYVEVSLEGCKYLCDRPHDLTCSVIVYLPKKRTCFLVGSFELEGNYEDPSCLQVQKHRKRRCTDDHTMMCDFDGSQCTLMQVQAEDQADWSIVKALETSESTITVDHTTDTGYGYVYYLFETNLYPGSTAKLHTSYRTTNGFCLEFFYVLRGSNQTCIRVMSVGEDLKTTVLAEISLLEDSTRGSDGTANDIYEKIDSWRHLYLQLPDGVNQLVIEGKRSSDEEKSGILLDDIHLWPCDQNTAQEENCISSSVVQKYQGTIAKTKTNTTCLNWNSTEIEKYITGYKLTFPDGNASYAVNYCRKPIANYGGELRRYDGPWCFIEKYNSIIQEECDISYCPCPDYMFQCDGYKCIPPHMACDGIAQCSDGKDETDQCVSKMKVDCDFGDVFMCGYSSFTQTQSFFSRANGDVGQFRYKAEFIPVGYVQAVSDGYTGGERGILVTPQYTSVTESCLSFYLISTKDDTDDTDLDNSVAVYVNDLVYPVAGRQVWKTESITKNNVSMVLPPGTYRIMVEATTASVVASYIALTNVNIEPGRCRGTNNTCDQDQFTCDNGKCVANNTLCDGVNDCGDESDELHENCTFSVECDFKEENLCGYKLRSSFAYFSWERTWDFNFTQKDVPEDGSNNPAASPTPPFGSGGGLTGSGSYGTGAGSSVNCGGTYTLGKGEITSPSYPYNYPSNAYCKYILEQPEGATITLEFVDMNIENARFEDEDGNIRCNYDYVEVYDGSTTNSPKLAHFCGENLNDVDGVSLVMHSTNNTVLVVFRSDYTFELKGFKATWEAEIPVGSVGMMSSNIYSYVMAARMGGDKPYPQGVASMQSPLVDIATEHCMSFRYFIRSNLTIVSRAQNESTGDVLFQTTALTGRSWHEASVTIPRGQYHLYFETNYREISLDPSITDTAILYSVAIADIKLEDGRCEDLVSESASLSCDFTSSTCDYTDVSIGPVGWTRIERFKSYYMAVGGITQTTKEKNYALLSPLVNVSENTCLSFETYVLWEKNKKPYDLTLQIYSTLEGGHPVEFLRKALDEEETDDKATSVKIPIQVRLRPGRQRLTMSVQTSWEGISGMVALGPLSTQECVEEEESKWDIECKSDKFGLKYRGYINESSEGLPCLKWVDVINQTNLEAALLNLNSTLRFDALNETAETAENYCRNPIHKDMTEPICFVDIVPNDAFEGVGNCNVPDCPEEDHSAPDTLTKEQFDVTLAAVKGNDKATSYGNDFDDYFFESPYGGYGGYNEWDYPGFHDYSSSHHSPTGYGNPTGTPSTTTPYQNIWNIGPPGPETPGSGSGGDGTGGGYGIGDVDGSGNVDSMVTTTTDVVTTDSLLMDGSTSMDGMPDDQTTEFPDDLFMTTDETPGAGARKKRDVGTTTTESPQPLLIPTYDGITDLESFYREAGHQPDNLIHACIWDGSKCDDSQISRIITDTGACTTFNGNPEQTIRTDKTGSGFGLQLTLNIEQYEYIKGPNTDAGIKVYLHEQSDIALVRDLGFVVSPGVHSLAATSLNNASSLKEPYGTCDEIYLPFFENEAYTYSRCRRNCETHGLLNVSNCIDAFMPRKHKEQNMRICNVNEYLDYVVPYIYSKGFNQDECDCPDACIVQSYAADLSYATLSSLSVDNILQENTNRDMDDLIASYHEALEIRHRVRTELLEQTIVGLQNISLALADFLWWSKTQGPISLKRVFKAVDLLVNVVKNDVAQISTDLKNYTNDYKHKRARATDDMFLQTAGSLETKLQLIYYRMQSLTELNFDANFTAAYENGDEAVTYDPSLEGYWHGLDDPGIDGDFFISARQLMIETKVAAQAVKAVIVQSGLPTDASNKTYIPTVWHPGKEWINPCNESIENLIMIDANGGVYYKINYGHIYDLYEAYPFAYQVFKLLMDLKRAKDCRMLYRDNLEKAVQAVDATNASIYDFKQVSDSMNSIVTFDFDKELENVQRNISWVDSLLRNYSRFDTSKLALAENISAETTTAISEMLLTLNSRMELRAFDPMRNQIRNARNNFREWCTKMIEVLAHFAPHFTAGEIEDIARRMDIWRQPLADLESPNILRFKYNSKLTWRTWPKSSPLDRFEQGSDSRVIETISSQYMETLQNDLYLVESHLESGKVDVIDAMEWLRYLLQDFKAKSQLDKNFIVDNFLKLDVYFPVLKFESLEQREAYRLENFFSEVGGYMGLLIGASALTICEVLDLIIYNIIIKIVDKGHRLRSIGDLGDSEEDEKKKHPPGSSVNPQTKQDMAQLEAARLMNEMPPIDELLKDPHKLQYQDNMYNPYPTAGSIRE